jgi:two-component system, NarL family, nitrate/nitrite response regulator NarL
MNRAEVRRFTGVRVSDERMITVVIIDERQLFIDALTALLAANNKFSVAACGNYDADPGEIVATRPDLALMGVGEPNDPPVRLIASLHQLAPELRTVIVADYPDAGLIRCVLQEDVAALVLTGVTGRDLETTLYNVLRGQAALPMGWQAVLAVSDRSPIASLSERQLEVLRMLADGCTYEEIGEKLIISVNTVKFHVRTIYLRLGVSNRTAAAKLLRARDTHPS